ncbi:hypothetical protein XAC2852_470057 [Xanthomonas citri pv. citri]|nr:hypothetical protein XAC2852_470057 [Xanthomonas citri pv. citri]
MRRGRRGWGRSWQILGSSGKQEEGEHEVQREEAHDHRGELALGEALLRPAGIGGAHRPHAPQQQHGEDETQHNIRDGRGREAAVGLERRDLIRGRGHRDRSRVCVLVWVFD